ncbi:MAG: MarR family winged helix-turn-helix transcriptional regulator [Candidatus Acidiferrales bacterium]
MPTHYDGNAKDRAALNAYINLIRASESILAQMSADLAAKGLTLSQFGAMEAVFHLGPLTQRELGRKLLRSAGSITVVTDNLEKHGWVRRERPKSDRRKALVHLTAAGRKRIERALPPHVKAIVTWMDRLEPEEQKEMRRLCRKLGLGEQKSDSKTRRSEAPSE